MEPPSTADLERTSLEFEGQGASPGVVCGPAFLSLSGLDRIEERRLRDDEVEAELARVDSAARAARVSLVHQRDQLAEHFTDEQRRIFDVHLTILEDPVLEADLRGRIVHQKMSFETALKDMIEVYERLFEVVESDALRNKLADMRDIALRLLHFAQPRERRGGTAEDMRGGVLVVRELSLSDLTSALDRGIAGLIAEEGSLISHGTILTRAAGIPAVIGVGGIHESIQEGDPVLVDGDGGLVVLRPSEGQVRAAGAAAGAATSAPLPALEPLRLADGTPMTLRAAVASPREARQAAAMGVGAIGLYRTELPVIQRAGSPREDSLAVLYGQVLNAAEDGVVFRLPDLDSTSGLDAVHPVAETNPALGLRGVRALADHPELLHLELRAILRAAEGRSVGVAVPFVGDLEDLRLVRASAERAREELRLEGCDVGAPLRIGAVFETPSSLLLAREILAHSDFALVGLDVLAQMLLAADVRSAYQSVRARIQRPHPSVLRALGKLVRLADGQDVPLAVYGECLVWPGAVELLVGCGVRDVVARTAVLPELHARLAELDPDLCERVVEQAVRTTTMRELDEGLPASWRAS